jgi:oligopeptidase B
VDDSVNQSEFPKATPSDLPATTLEPPRAVRIDSTASHHGHVRHDPYAWLRAADWESVMQDPNQLPGAIRDYLDAENAYAEALMHPTTALQAELVKELRGRIQEDEASVPVADGAWAYYRRYRPGGQHPVFCRIPRSGYQTAIAGSMLGGGLEDEQVLIDGDAEAIGQTYFRILAVEHSPDHRQLAWAADLTGAEVCRIMVRDLDSRTTRVTSIEGARGDLSFSADGRYLFYTQLDSQHRSRWVRRHDLVSGNDEIVFEDPDPGFFVGVDRSLSGRYILFHCNNHVTSEVWSIPASEPHASPRCLLPRQDGVDYSVEDYCGGVEAVTLGAPAADEHWVVRDNGDGAGDFRLRLIPAGSETGLRIDQAVTLVAHRSGRLIEDVCALRNHLLRIELEDGLPRIVVRRWADGEERVLSFSEQGYTLNLLPGPELDAPSLRFGYSSFTTPYRVHEEDLESGARRLLKQERIPSGHDAANYVTARLHARAPDGAQVPVSLFHHKDLKPGADTPLLLSGYGAYGLIDLPAFSGNRLSLVDRGFVYALAHVRGGREKGDHWYRQGKLAHKHNTFDDTIAVAEALISAGYTGPGRIALQGGSAGGLLVGAVLNRRPELFHAAIADVPFVDVLNTMLDPSLPLTAPEWPEWGNPLDSAADYATILAYSPYDNVKPQGYPHLLVTAGVSDPRVLYWEPAKWVARLRTTRTDNRLLLLKTNMQAGHGGASGRFDYLHEVAYRYAFLLMVFGKGGDQSSAS